MILDRLIVMDGVSGLADRSEDFASFLTVSKKMWSDVCLRYLYDLPYKTTLTDDTCADRNI